MVSFCVFGFESVSGQENPSEIRYCCLDDDFVSSNPSLLEIILYGPGQCTGDDEPSTVDARVVLVDMTQWVLAGLGYAGKMLGNCSDSIDELMMGNSWIDGLLDFITSFDGSVDVLMKDVERCMFAYMTLGFVHLEKRFLAVRDLFSVVMEKESESVLLGFLMVAGFQILVIEMVTSGGGTVSSNTAVARKVLGLMLQRFDGLLYESLSSDRDLLSSVNLTTFEVANAVSTKGNSVIFLGVHLQFDLFIFSTDYGGNGAYILYDLNVAEGAHSPVPPLDGGYSLCKACDVIYNDSTRRNLGVKLPIREVVTRRNQLYNWNIVECVDQVFDWAVVKISLMGLSKVSSQFAVNLYERIAWLGVVGDCFENDRFRFVFMRILVVSSRAQICRRNHRFFREGFENIETLVCVNDGGLFSVFKENRIDCVTLMEFIMSVADVSHWHIAKCVEQIIGWVVEKRFLKGFSYYSDGDLVCFGVARQDVKVVNLETDGFCHFDVILYMRIVILGEDPLYGCHRMNEDQSLSNGIWGFKDGVEEQDGQHDVVVLVLAFFNGFWKHGFIWVNFDVSIIDEGGTVLLRYPIIFRRCGLCIPAIWNGMYKLTGKWCHGWSIWKCMEILLGLEWQLRVQGGMKKDGKDEFCRFQNCEDWVLLSRHLNEGRLQNVWFLLNEGLLPCSWSHVSRAGHVWYNTEGLGNTGIMAGDWARCLELVSSYHVREMSAVGTHLHNYMVHYLLFLITVGYVRHVPSLNFRLFKAPE